MPLTQVEQAALSILQLMESRRLLPKEAWGLCRTMTMTFRPTASLVINVDNILVARNAFAHKSIVGVDLQDCLDGPLWFLKDAQLERLRIHQRWVVEPRNIAMPLGSMHVCDLVYDNVIAQGGDTEWMSLVGTQLASVHRVIMRECQVDFPALPADIKCLDIWWSRFYTPVSLGSCIASLESIKLSKTSLDHLLPDFSICVRLRELTVTEVGIGTHGMGQGVVQPAVTWPASLTYLELGYQTEYTVDLRFTPLPRVLKTLCLWSLARLLSGDFPQGLKEVQIASAGCRIPPSALPASLHTLTLKASAQYKPGDPNPLATYPVGLKVLKFECDNFPYPIGSLPEGLESLMLPAKYSRRLGVLPAWLKSLTVPERYPHPILTSAAISIYVR
ncbi:hypothetical protein JKP88DRAFT_319877 [Tribonema minus]|uniref:Uncharacterized protein n=1 Tax=Tribonema minus TaxID=303371 RepID=A0A835YV53_9STRA|nr:hypothetical protein JKP88DRAFT_319877 [Tribonema minus]